MSAPVLLFVSTLEPPAPWQEALQSLLPELKVRIWPDIGRREDVEYALVWKPPPHMFHGLPSLKVIFSLGAGVDHLLTNTELPPTVPVVRMVDSALTEGMSEYVLFHVLRYHRHMAQYQAQQHQRVWQQLPQSRPAECRIGIMGTGVMGTDVAGKLAQLGFDVAGWSQSAKRIQHVKGFHGREQLTSFLQRTDILVCLLPLTSETEGILNGELFVALPRGAYLINAGRGRHLVEDDLPAALDSGHIAGATLDVFQTEPLPGDHPFWQHSKVTVTPHIASLTNPYTAAAHVADNIRRHRRGDSLTHVVDVKRGY